MAFSTARLQARPVEAADAPLFERLWADDRVARTLGGSRDRAQVEAALAEAAVHWAQWGFGRWLLCADEHVVGTVKLAVCDLEQTQEVELGYALFPEFWGAGYATEAAAGALKYGRDVAGLHEVVAYALATNEASISVMRRLDFAFERNLNLPVGPHVLYRRVLSG